MAEKKAGRMQNLEELRCLAMMMVVVLHFLGKGNLLAEAGETGESFVRTVAWVPEVLCIVAVNVYMLISGYFLSQSSFKLSRLLTLYLQIWMYSVGVGLLAVFAGLTPAEEINTHYFLSLLFPVSMEHYWFMTAYIYLYLLLPFVGSAVRRMTKEQLKLALILLLSVFCVLKSLLPFRLEKDAKGYDVLWYLCVFLVAAYIRSYGMGILKTRLRCIFLYAGGCLGALGVLWFMRFLYGRTGSFGLIMENSIDYNHILILLASLGLFGFFIHGKGEGYLGKLAGRAAPYVLGVYLLHENMGIRYVWQDWFKFGEIETVMHLILSIITSVIVMFTTGVIIEWLRCLLVKGVSGLLSHCSLWRRFMGRIAEADDWFTGTDSRDRQ